MASTEVTVTVRALLASLYDEGFAEDDAIDRVLVDADEATMARFVRVAMRDVYRNLDRTRTRHAEDGVRTSAVGQTLGDAVSGPAARAALMERSFSLPDGRFVEWLSATADDHRMRARWQRANATGARLDAELHEAAAAVIVEHGVTCLADLPEDLRPAQGALV